MFHKVFKRLRSSVLRFNMKKIFAASFVLVMLVLLALSAVPVVALSSQVSVQKFAAKGGVPGHPPKEPEPEPDPTGVEYELFVEIDYLDGHRPTDSVLVYVYEYYYERGIEVTFYLDDPNGYSDVVDDPTPDDGITDSDFSDIKANYDDNDDGSFSKWKWVLYGSTVEDEPNVIGYTAEVWVNINYNPRNGRITSVDGLAGNYIFIADETADNWADTQELEVGAEAVVLMHELGHTIGILKVGSYGNYYRGFTLYEIYDSDSASVMAKLSTANAGLYGAWYYSDAYWPLKNLEYYAL